MRIIKNILLISLNLFLLAAGCILCFICSNIKTNSYSSAKEGIITATPNDKRLSNSFSGQWEFYYNSFIVTDHVQRECDAYIEMPSKWTNLQLKNGKVLSNEGYASYKLTINNMNEYSQIEPSIIPLNVSMRIYINEQLVCQSGKLGKTKQDNKTSYRYDYLTSYVVDETKTCEIVIEVGYNQQGGIDTLPNFIFPNYANFFQSIVRFMPFIILLLFLIICIVELVSVFKVSDSTLHTFVTAAGLFFYYLTSPDLLFTLASLNLYYHVIAYEILNFIFFMVVICASLSFISYTYQIKHPKYHFIYSSILLTISLGCYCGLMNLDLQWIGFLIFCIGILPAIINIFYFIIKNNIFNSTLLYSFMIISLTTGMEIVELLDYTNSIVLNTNGAYIIYMIFIFVLFIAVYISFIIRTYKQAYKSSQYQLEAIQFKTNVLQEQIKPHFIFNSLNVIKSLYHKDIEKGDYAIGLFSNHLKMHVEAANKTLIPFEQELENIENFINLENLKHQKAFNVIYNIEYFDFEVPILSLQPFVENAIKYSKINEVENGVLEISSIEKDNEIVIEIKDNGIGFDINQIQEHSHGIKNSKERFKLLLNTDILINSAPQQGTTIQIRLHKEGRDDE